MAVEKVIKLKVENGEALLNIEEVNKALADTNKQTDNLNETMSSATEAIDKFTGGAASGLKAVVSGVKTFIGSLTAVKTALVATGLGALVVVLGSLFTYFTQTSRGADKFAEIMGGVSAAVKVVIDRVVLLGEGIVELFSGNFTKAIETVKNAFTGIGAEIVKETKAGAALAKQLDEIEDRERDLIKLRAKANLQITEARLIADDQTKSIEEREKAVRRAAELEGQVAAAEQKNAQAYVKYLKERIKLGESTDEDLRQLAEKEAEVDRLRAETSRRNKKLQSELNQLKQEQKALDDAALERTKKLSEEEQKLADLRKQWAMEDSAAREKNAIEQEVTRKKNIDSFRDALAQFRASNMNAQQQELAAAEQQYTAITTLAIKAGKDTTALTAEYEEKKKQIKKKYANEERAREIAAAAQSVELVSQSLGAIAGLVEALSKGNERNAEKNFKITKALRIAEAVANTAAGIMSQLAVPQDALTGANFVKAGIVAATGAAQVAIISSTKFQKAGASAGRVSSPSIPTSTPTATPMTPNIQFGNTENQLAGLLGQPMRAYVVNQDIQSANQLERKIRSSATIGG
jgi:myosin heavy subunit